MKGFEHSFENLQQWEQRKLLIRANIANRTGIRFNKAAKPVECVETKVTDMGSMHVKNLYWRVLNDYYVA
jgi:hypothetical protein